MPTVGDIVLFVTGGHEEYPAIVMKVHPGPERLLNLCVVMEVDDRRRTKIPPQIAGVNNTGWKLKQ